MKPKNNKNYAEWIIKAREDELSINAIMKSKGAPSTACFLSQQMAEKYLKAYLTYLKKPFPKIHDLLLLAEKLPEINQFREEIKLLNRYYIETRYPGDYPEFTKREAAEAFQAAKKIRDFILKRIK